MIPSERRSRSRPPGSRPRHLPPLDEVLVPFATAAVGKVVAHWSGSRRSTVVRILRGAIAGAGAAGILHAYRRLVEHDEESELPDELLAGAGKGIAYAAVLHPVLPGPSLLRGFLVGTADFLMVPWGGLYSTLQDLSPARKLPIVDALLETGDAEDDPYRSFLIYGVALAILHGDGRRKRDGH